MVDYLRSCDADKLFCRSFFREHPICCDGCRKKQNRTTAEDRLRTGGGRAVIPLESGALPEHNSGGTVESI